MDDFKTQVKTGFQKCRSDIEVISMSNSKLENEVYELKEQNNELKSLVREMSSQMNELKAELKGVGIALDYIKDFNQNRTVNPVVQQPQAVVQEVPIREEPVKKEKKVNEIKDPYEALLAFKAKTNKRELLKEKMLQMLEENDGMVLSELKFLFVDHFKYCSKATFYNYLKEIELEKYIKISRDGGKNRVYLARPDIISQENYN